MIVRLSAASPPVVDDVGDLARLHVTTDAEPLRPAPPLVRVADDDHVWLDIAALRAAADPGGAEQDWSRRWDAMIAYASGKGWLDASGTALRAHVESEA